MSVRPIDVITIQQLNEVSNQKQNENTRPAAQQANMVTQEQKKVNEQSESVVQKRNADNDGKKYDARDKSSNEYGKEDKKKNGQDKNEKSDGVVFLKGTKSAFDIKI